MNENFWWRQVRSIRAVFMRWRRLKPTLLKAYGSRRGRRRCGYPKFKIAGPAKTTGTQTARRRPAVQEHGESYREARIGNGFGDDVGAAISALIVRACGAANSIARAIRS